MGEMDEENESGPFPVLDESFVAAASFHEPSISDRQLAPDRHREELARRSERRPRRAPSNRTRQIIGVLIAVAVIVAAYVPTQFLGGHRSTSLLGPYLGPNTSCSSYKYPAGAQYRFEGCSGGQPIGWSRCATLTVSVDSRQAPAAWSSDTGFALNQLAGATGLRFRPVSSGADIAISWTPSLLASGNSQADKAGVTYVAMQEQFVGVGLKSAVIQISSRLAGGAARNGEVPVLLHELGHAVGLAHFTGPDVMNPVDQGYGTYQGGDLAGLATLYRSTACP
ncbi:MAG TPA: hypothetical protein VG435_15205 [Acidimicrobiales bacterium]|nr:hypothetical protein [Acidimicrobiales bacterium]